MQDGLWLGCVQKFSLAADRLARGLDFATEAGEPPPRLREDCIRLERLLWDVWATAAEGGAPAGRQLKLATAARDGLVAAAYSLAPKVIRESLLSDRVGVERGAALTGKLWEQTREPVRRAVDELLAVEVLPTEYPADPPAPIPPTEQALTTAGQSVKPKPRGGRKPTDPETAESLVSDWKKYDREYEGDGRATHEAFIEQRNRNARKTPEGKEALNARHLRLLKNGLRNKRRKSHAARQRTNRN
jgi:hypothetical protein